MHDNSAGSPLQLGPSPLPRATLNELVRLANHPAVLAALKEHEQPKWLSVADAARVYGISRTRLYELITDGTIRSVSLRKKHHVRGSRRVLASSLDEFYERHATGGADV